MMGGKERPMRHVFPARDHLSIPFRKARHLPLSLGFFLVFSTACSPSGELSQARPGADAVSDGGVLASECGDGLLAVDEQCDDGQNGDPHDGCRDDCTFSCESALDCLDGERCNGAETCDRSTHRCVGGPPFDDGAVCRRLDESRGVCRAERCVAPGCGNGVLEASEECDDGDRDDTDGCRPDCTFSCHSAEDCDDGDLCNGQERCDEATHRCVSSPPLRCDDGDRCTVSYCDPERGCRTRLIDYDGDGFAPASLGVCSTAIGRGGDCQDENPMVHPGQRGYFSGPYASRFETWSWDYDCDGVERPVETRVSRAACFPSAGCEGVEGWVGVGPPRCGGAALHRRCLVGEAGCDSRVETFVQACR